MAKKVSQQYSAMAVVFYNGQILTTVEDIYGKQALSLPKGHLESGETAVEAAIRECFEETNVIITLSQVIGEIEPFVISFTTPDGKEVSKMITPIVFKTSYKCDPKPIERRILSVNYMDVEEFLVNCSYDNVREVVQKAIKILDK